MGLESGILKALEDTRMLDKVKIIAFDYSENLKSLMQKGIIISCIDQEQSNQGYKVVMSAFNSLLTSTFSNKKQSFVDLRILLKESL